MNELGNKRVFAINLKKELDKSGKTRYEVCKATGIRYSTMTDWLNEKTYPRFSRIEKLAEYFGVEVENLVGTGTSESVIIGELGELLAMADEKTIDIIRDILKLNKRDKNIVASLLKNMTQKEEEQD